MTNLNGETMNIQIKSHFTGSILFEGEFGSLKLCVEAAVKARAYLAGAYLAGANLARANLDGANLDGANLVGANLVGANLARANLARANLDGANLDGANLGGAYLVGANLARANLDGANLGGAYLVGAYLAGAYLAGANLAGANLAGPPPATQKQAVANLDTVREIILAEPNKLYMNHWHDDDKWKTRTCAEEAVCGTTHCLAGWLQVCAIDKATRELPPHIAGYIQAPVAAPMFYKTNDEVRSWLKKREYANEEATA